MVGAFLRRRIMRGEWYLQVKEWHYWYQGLAGPGVTGDQPGRVGVVERHETEK